MFWIFMCAALVAVIYFILVKPFIYWQKNGVPQYNLWNTWLDILQNLIQYRNVADSTQKVYNDFPGTRFYGMYQFLTPTLAIKDPDLIKQITVKDFDHFADHFNFLPLETDPLWQKNLFFLKGEQWRDMRIMLSPSFTGSKMKIMFGLISDCAKQFVQYFEEQGAKTINVEMRDIFTRFTNDVIATSAFGVTCDSMRNQDNEFYIMGKKGTNFGGGLWDSLKFFLNFLCPQIAKIIGVKIIKEDVSKFFLNVIKSNIQSREKNGIIRPDMIHLLLEARKGKSKPEKSPDSIDLLQENKSDVLKEQLTDDDIAAQAFIFFLAGFDSVATLMYFMAYELAMNPDIQERLQREIDDLRTDCGDSLTYEDLTKLKYMDMVISETLRKWPNTIILDRICVKPYTIEPVRDGEQPVHIKKGDLIWFPLFGIQRDPENYPEPDRFDPERFSEENKSKINPYVNLGFGTGPRVCIGSRFALMETKLVFFYLLAKFDITVIDKTPIPLQLDPSVFQLIAKGGFWMGLKPRK